MRKCVNCKASIASDVNFCPRCGASQTTGPVDTEAETLRLEDQIAPPAPDTVRMSPPTVPVTTAIQPPGRRMKNVFIGAGIFLVSLMIGAGIMFELRSRNTGDEQTAVGAPVQVNPQTAQPTNGVEDSKPTVIIENPNEDKSDSFASSPEEIAKKSDETAKKELERKEKELGEREARLKEPSAVPFPTAPKSSQTPPSGLEDLPGIDSRNAPDATDRGVIAVRFRIEGDALVKVRGSDVSVLPVSGSTVGEVTRLIGRPLPSERCRVTIRQKPFTGAAAALIEEPNARNNFTATIRVRSINRSRETAASFAIVWNSF